MLHFRELSRNSLLAFLFLLCTQWRLAASYHICHLGHKSFVHLTQKAMKQEQAGKNVMTVPLTEPGSSRYQMVEAAHQIVPILMPGPTEHK
jgi:hypothetical protein